MEEVYTPKMNKIEWAESKTKGTLQKLVLLVLIKSIQKLGFFIRVIEVREVLVQHIAKKARLPMPSKLEWKAFSESRTAKRHFRFIRDYLQIRPFDHEANQIMINTMSKLAFRKDDPADGTKWDLYEQNLLSDNHIRYGDYGGIGYYHVSDTYIALFSNFIPCGVWEGIHILDILMNDKAEIQPEILHSDTQGLKDRVQRSLDFLLY